MINKSDYDVYKLKMESTLEYLDDEFANIRAGRANPGILNKLTVEYYGVQTPITQVGAVSVPEARMLVFQPYDMSVLKEVEKAIFKSDIGITPNNDGKVIRLVFPPLTEERRLELKKQIKKLGEDAKVSVRGIRRDAIEAFKAMKKKSEITEDDVKQAEGDIQKFTDKYVEEIDKKVASKEKEVMEI
ncbi:MAG: ribosome recycling factor [Ruminococcaceae bacterium]|nr:ribosome recycling factor [Oscillospiraceae bacterium]